MREPSCSGSLPHFDGDAAESKGKRGEFIWDFGAGRDPDNVEGTATPLQRSVNELSVPKPTQAGTK